MRTTPALRILTAALLTGGAFAAAAAGTTASAAPAPAHADGHDSSYRDDDHGDRWDRGDRGDGNDRGDRGGRGGPVWGTVVSRAGGEVRTGPSVHSRVVDRLSPGSEDRIQCTSRGQSLNGNSSWYWMVGARGWVNAGSIDTHGRWVSSCDDPCPRWRDGDGGRDRGTDRGDRGDQGRRDGSWAGSGSGSWSASASGSWSWSDAGGSSSW
ncbi:SH3 domain-containing protein [Streptomyces griseoviridis]|uniref:SH3 domain-containing protein n=1 Tax=Streptomyces griseoviridis TaxID=45398 RepID=A0A3S9ZE47_STRGD|nr:SH3 domain-containing protein [Streptomyces griseoviridis]AZS86076.1 SH3 domain-containing protein [Streptomyces griseoviridis]QCN87064.1 hypothetical protein DDJ31_20595 [Streptomyces griseoviridis]